MTFNHRHLALLSLIFATAYFASSTALFCSELTSKKDKETPCFLEPPTFNPALIRSSSNSLILPCHVARSKHSIVEWWYTDLAHSVSIRIYPAFPAVRPTVLRFITNATPVSKNANETDILDVSILLRFVNVDDSGTYRCVIRPWSTSNAAIDDEIPKDDDDTKQSLSYHVELTAPRLCQSSPGPLPCFASMRTSSPTVVDAYKTAFLQCVIQNNNGLASAFWVVGNASANSVLITDYLSTNQHNGDRLRRVFPHSPFDISLEVSINRDVYERSYSCVIDGAADEETTLFTYIIRSIDLNDITEKKIVARKNSTVTIETTTVEDTDETTADEIEPHDSLTAKLIESLRRKHKIEPPENDEDELENENELFSHKRHEESVKPAIDT